MYERLVQKLVNRNVGAIAGTLGTKSPTGGKTSCTVESGSFPYTYDGDTSTRAGFKIHQTCESEWYWTDPVNVTKFNIHSLFYYPASYIVVIWGRVGDRWVQLWYGTWKLAHNKWDSKAISCDNCTGIMISQQHVDQAYRPYISEVTVDYTIPAPTGTAAFQETSAKVGDIINADFTWTNAVKRGAPYYHYAVMWIKDPNGTIRIRHFELVNATGSKTLAFKTDKAGTWKCQIDVWNGISYISCTDTVPVSAVEGKAVITNIFKPSTFTPNVQFRITVMIRNDGASDTLFVRLTNRDTGVVLKYMERVVLSGYGWTAPMDIILTQETDFHGRIDAGHIE